MQLNKIEREKFEKQLAIPEFEKLSLLQRGWMQNLSCESMKIKSDFPYQSRASHLASL